MLYVIAALLILAVIFGFIQTKKIKSQKNKEISGCGGGCSGCAHHEFCGQNEKKWEIKRKINKKTSKMR